MIAINPNQTTITQGESVTETEAFLRALHGEGSVFEIRIPNARIDHDREQFRTVVGVFNEPRAAAEQIARFDAENQPPAIYVTLQKLSPSVFCRCTNQGLDRGNAVKDSDVEAYRWVLVDFDPKRKKGVSSTEEELQAAAAKADEVAAWLEGRGFPTPLRMLSGNGHHLYLRVNLPASEKSLVKRFLQALSTKFSDDQVELDRSVHNPSRITKVAGTWARKGETTEERPHRMARWLNPELVPEVVAKELLEEVIKELKPPAPSAPSPKHRLVSGRGMGADYSLPQLEPIRQGCAFIRHCIEDAETLDEPDWLAGLSITSRCEDGDELSHEMSRSYPTYSFEETQKKIEHAKKAGCRLCSTIEADGFEGCKSCPHRGKIRSPIALGYGRLVLSKATPLDSAKELRRRLYSAAGMTTLVHQNEEFLEWNGTKYSTLEETGIRQVSYRFLDGAKVLNTSAKEEEDALVPFCPNQNSVNQVIDALKAEAHIPSTLSSWCSSSSL